LTHAGLRPGRRQLSQQKVNEQITAFRKIYRFEHIQQFYLGTAKVAAIDMKILKDGRFTGEDIRQPESNANIVQKTCLS
jgi:hypothetical protein